MTPRNLSIIVSVILLILPIGVTMFDIYFFDNQVSPSIVPDGHSILPSLYLLLLVGVLALWQPESFLCEIRGPQPLKYRDARGDAPAWELRSFDLPEDDPAAERKFESDFDKKFLNWRRCYVVTHLWPDRWVALIAFLLAFCLTLCDFLAGYPLPWGLTTFLVAFYEGAALWVVFSSSLIFSDMVRAVHQFPQIFDEKPDSSDRFLSRMDPEAVRRLGTIFIGGVANSLLIFTLLLISRLHWLNFPRWRWDVVVRGYEIRLGLIVFAVALIFILGYWYYCYRTFRRLIQRIKDSKLRQLSRKWRDQSSPDPNRRPPPGEEACRNRPRRPAERRSPARSSRNAARQSSPFPRTPGVPADPGRPASLCLSPPLRPPSRRSSAPGPVGSSAPCASGSVPSKDFQRDSELICEQLY